MLWLSFILIAKTYFGVSDLSQSDLPQSDLSQSDLPQSDLSPVVSKSIIY